MNLLPEISFKTTRSGGKGGQNVNKVETAVIASFNIDNSALLTGDQKAVISEKLRHRINAEGNLQVKAQVHRTQLSNKEEAVRKIQDLVERALVKKKARIATRTTKAAKEKRLESKKRNAEIKSGRKPFRNEGY